MCCVSKRFFEKQRFIEKHIFHLFQSYDLNNHKNSLKTPPPSEEAFAPDDTQFSTISWVVQFLGGAPNSKTHVPVLKIGWTKFFQNFYGDPWPGPKHIPKPFSIEIFRKIVKIRSPKTAKFKISQSHIIIQALTYNGIVSRIKKNFQWYKSFEINSEIGKTDTRNTAMGLLTLTDHVYSPVQ